GRRDERGGDRRARAGARRASGSRGAQGRAGSGRRDANGRRARVRRDLVVAAKVLALPTLALGFVAGSLPGRLGIAAPIYPPVLAATALGVTLAALRRAYPPARPLPRSP